MYKVSLLLLLFILTLSRESKASFIFLRFVSFLGENLWCLKGSIAIATKKSYTYPEDMNKRNAINKKCHSATRPLPVGTCGASLAFGNIMNQSNPVFGGHELLVEAGFCPLLDLWPPPARAEPQKGGFHKSTWHSRCPLFSSVLWNAAQFPAFLHHLWQSTCLLMTNEQVKQSLLEGFAFGRKVLKLKTPWEINIYWRFSGSLKREIFQIIVNQIRPRGNTPRGNLEGHCNSSLKRETLSFLLHA